MAYKVRSQVSFVMSIVMIALAFFFLARITVLGSAPATGRLWLDIAFILFFFMRGWMNYRDSRRPPPGAMSPRATPPEQQF